MNKIRYRNTNIAKQILLITCFLYILMRAIIMAEIIIYKIDKYYESTNIPLTLILYIILFTLVIILFRSNTYCMAAYDDKKLIYYNKLLRKEHQIEFSNVKTVILDTFGVYFYDHERENTCKNEAIFYLPFFRGGIIDAVQVDGLFRTLTSIESIHVIKKFKILPGYGNKWKWLSIIYGFLAICVFINCATPLYVIIILFQNH